MENDQDDNLAPEQLEQLVAPSSNIILEVDKVAIAEAQALKQLHDDRVSEIIRISKMPPPEKWRAIVELCKKENPRFAYSCMEAAEEVRKARMVQLNQSTQSQTRTFIFPENFLNLLCRIDSELNWAVGSDGKSNIDQRKRKQYWRKIAKVFPEFTVTRYRIG